MANTSTFIKQNKHLDSFQDLHPAQKMTEIGNQPFDLM